MPKGKEKKQIKKFDCKIAEEEGGGDIYLTFDEFYKFKVNTSTQMIMNYKNKSCIMFMIDFIVLM